MNAPGADWLAQVRALGVSTVAAAFGRNRPAEGVLMPGSGAGFSGPCDDLVPRSG